MSKKHIVNGVEMSDTDILATPVVETSPYGVVTCARPNTETVSEKFGRKSTATIVVVVPITSIGMSVEGTIWGRLVRLADGSGEKVEFDTAVPRGMKAINEDAKLSFQNHVNAAALAWNGYDRATSDAADRLLGEKRKDQKRVELAPRLVKRQQAATPAA